MEAESFVTKPILFGNFMKIGAPESDKMYEEMTDMVKVNTVLTDVGLFFLMNYLCPTCIHVLTYVCMLIRDIKPQILWVYLALVLRE